MGTKTILIIDDMSFDRLILSKVLSKKIDCRILEASGGEEAFKLIQTEEIDMILLDVDMPQMPGDEVVAKIRETKKQEELPIIMVSGRSEDAVIVKCLNAGANDYIGKPINFEVAITRILNHLALADAIKDQLHLKELAAISAMITTYQHEINNPLAIANLALGSLKKVAGKESAYQSLSESIARITEVVEKINKVSKQKEVIFETYSGTAKMVKVDKK